MDTKLTINLDREIVEKAKKYAASHKKSLSNIIEAYLKSLVNKKGPVEANEIQISPFIKSISGKVKVPLDLDYKAVYRKRLDQKYK